MPGLVPGIYVLGRNERMTWMAGTSPAMTRLLGGLSVYRDTCAETASHLPFCFAQQSV
jgi:hypothetical protein